MIRWWRKEIKSEEMWRLKKERNKLSKETTALSNLQANITQRKGFRTTLTCWFKKTKQKKPMLRP